MENLILSCSSSVIETLRTDNTLFLAFFYFDFSDPASRDLSALASSLISQLAKCSDACMDYLQNERSSGRSDQLPTFEKLLNMLSKMLCLSRRTFIVIDALDECPESAREKGLAPFLDCLCSPNIETKNLRLFVTSRNEVDIRNMLLPRSPCLLSLHDALQHTKDLSRHVATHLDRKEYRWPSGVKKSVHEVLTTRSQGM